MLKLISTLFLLVPVAAYRQRIRATASDAGNVKLDPFSIVLTVENKREIMDSYVTSWFGGILDYALSDIKFTTTVAEKLTTMLPPALANAGIDCTLKTDTVDGLTARLTMQIIGFDMASVIKKGKGDEFADAVMSLEGIFQGLEMPDKFAEIEEKVGIAVRTAFMTKVPPTIQEKLGDKGIKVAVTTEPEPPPPEPEPKLAPEPSWDLIYRVTIPERTAIADQAGSKLKTAAVKMMPQPKFLSTVRKILEAKTVEGIRQKIGDGLKLSIRTMSDADAGSGGEKDSFWLIVEVDSVNVQELLTMAKGETFATNFAALFGALERLREGGLTKMKVVMKNINTAVDAKVLEGIGNKLPEALASKLGAEVASVSKADYNELQHVFAPWGRCCAKEDDSQHFWIKSELMHGGGILGLGHGRQGHCPRVVPNDALSTGCVSQGFKQPGTAIQTHFRSYTDCFGLSQASTSGHADSATILTANKVEATC